jgi:hypothetical protein
MSRATTNPITKPIKRCLEEDFANVAHPPVKRPRTFSSIPHCPISNTVPLFKGHGKTNPFTCKLRKRSAYKEDDNASDSDSEDVSKIREVLRGAVLREKDLSTKKNESQPKKPLKQMPLFLNMLSDDDESVDMIRPKAKDVRIKVEHPARFSMDHRIAEFSKSKMHADACIERAIEDLATLRYMLSRLKPEAPTGRIFGLSVRKSYNVIADMTNMSRNTFINAHDAIVEFQVKQRERYSIEGLNLHETSRPMAKK